MYDNPAPQRRPRFGFNTHGNVIPVPNPGGRNVTLIAAMDARQGLGKQNMIPWRCPPDLRQFKRLTTGHVVIMGRKTWESLGRRPLPGRTNIVITRDVTKFYDELTQEHLPDILALPSLTVAIESVGESQIFIIGGGEIYELAMPFVNDMIITNIEDIYITDTQFPPIARDQYLEPVYSTHAFLEMTFRYTYWRRIQREPFK